MTCRLFDSNFLLKLCLSLILWRPWWIACVPSPRRILSLDCACSILYCTEPWGHHKHSILEYLYSIRHVLAQTVMFPWFLSFWFILFFNFKKQSVPYVWEILRFLQWCGSALIQSGSSTINHQYWFQTIFIKSRKKIYIQICT